MDYQEELGKYLPGQTILSFVSIDAGGDSISYKVTTDKNNFILRTGGMRENYDVEHAFLKLLLNNKVKVGMPVADGKFSDGTYFSLQQQLPGIDLYSVSEQFWPAILKEVGGQMHKAYQISVPGFGQISPEIFRKTGELVGSKKSWFAAVEEYFDYRSGSLAKRIREDLASGQTYISKELFLKVVAIVEKIPEVKKRIKLLTNKVPQAKIMHGDLHFEHFLVTNDHLSGIIDWNHTWVGDPLFDVAYLSIMPHGELYGNFLTSSGVKMDNEVFRLYRLLISVGKIHTRYVKKDYLEDYPEVVTIALEELEK